MDDSLRAEIRALIRAEIEHAVVEFRRHTPSSDSPFSSPAESSTSPSTSATQTPTTSPSLRDSSSPEEYVRNVFHRVCQEGCNDDATPEQCSSYKAEAQVIESIATVELTKLIGRVPLIKRLMSQKQVSEEGARAFLRSVAREETKACLARKKKAWRSPHHVQWRDMARRAKKTFNRLYGNGTSAQVSRVHLGLDGMLQAMVSRSIIQDKNDIVNTLRANFPDISDKVAVRVAKEFYLKQVPPLPAKQYVGSIKKGLDGKHWISVKKNGRTQWVRHRD